VPAYAMDQNEEIVERFIEKEIVSEKGLDPDSIMKTLYLKYENCPGFDEDLMSILELDDAVNKHLQWKLNRKTVGKDRIIELKFIIENCGYKNWEHFVKKSCISKDNEIDKKPCFCSTKGFDVFAPKLYPNLVMPNVFRRGSYPDGFLCELYRMNISKKYVNIFSKIAGSAISCSLLFYGWFCKKKSAKSFVNKFVPISVAAGLLSKYLMEVIITKVSGKFLRHRALGKFSKTYEEKYDEIKENRRLMMVAAREELFTFSFKSMDSKYHDLVVKTHK